MVAEKDLQRLETLDWQDRTFQLWEYRVSHGGLLIRSPMGPATATNIDLVFDGVEHLSCPRLFRGLSLHVTGEVEVLSSLERVISVGSIGTKFRLESGHTSWSVTASSLRISENTDDIFSSPFPWRFTPSPRREGVETLPTVAQEGGSPVAGGGGDRSEVLEVVSELVSELVDEDLSDWENTSLQEYLSAFWAALNQIDEYYTYHGEVVPGSPWALVARAMLIAKVME